MWKTETFRRLNTKVELILGERTANHFAKLGVETVWDLIRHIPRRYFSGTQNSDLANLVVGETVAVVAQVSDFYLTGSPGRQRLRCLLTDGKGQLSLTFFGKNHLLQYWSRQLAKASKGIFTGKISSYRGQLQMNNPDFVMLDTTGAIVGRATKSGKQMADSVTRSAFIPIYPATAKLSTWEISNCQELALTFLTGISDPIPENILEETSYMSFLAAVSELHNPSSETQVAKAKERLVFDEAFIVETALAYQRITVATRKAPKLVHHQDGLLARLDARLPFDLTSGQKEVGQTISADMARDVPMQRLLQGEVGSGKTVVALRAMCQTVDNNYQAVLLAPTEVLASQHAKTISGLLGDLCQAGILGAGEKATEVVLLTGSMSQGEKRAALMKIVTGDAGIVVGTHALLSEKVEFFRVGLVVVDEQHRFGVEQRAKLTELGDLRPHELVMSATPIPRSIAMTVYGDLDISVLKQVPARRSAVQTTLVSLLANPTWLARAWQRVREEVEQGHQVFVVCPRIYPGTIVADSQDHQSTSEQHNEFVFGESVFESGVSVVELVEQLKNGPLDGLRISQLHGELAAEVKEQTMQAFAAGQIDVLVCTTVIEVGVDIPNATMMIIMDADRFGISQLHQLRGRIGRGNLPGLCLLVASCDPKSVAGERLKAVVNSNDGFELAELDLLQRREGNILGANQSGKSVFKLLDVTKHADTIVQARNLAKDAVEESFIGSTTQDSEKDQEDSGNILLRGTSNPANILSDPNLADMVEMVESQTAKEWLARN